MEQRCSYILLTAMTMFWPLVLTQGVAPLCTRAGVFPYPGDCSKFMTCVTSNHRDGFLTRVHLCPTNTVFKYNTCVPIDQVPDCKIWRSSQLTDEVDATTPEPPVTCMGRFRHCHDCKQIVQCTFSIGEGFINPESQRCDSLSNGTKPYCNSATNSCSADVPDECKHEGVKCEEPGFFPDPSNCRLGYFCGAKGSNPVHSLVCNASAPAQTVSTIRNECTNQMSPAECIPIKCPAEEVAFITYPRDDRYFVLCNPFDPFNKTMVMYKCQGYNKVHKGNGHCEFECKRAGRFRDDNDPESKKYFLCTGLRLPPKPVSISCPRSLIFDPAAGRCDAKETIVCGKP